MGKENFVTNGKFCNALQKKVYSGHHQFILSQSAFIYVLEKWMSITITVSVQSLFTNLKLWYI